MAAEYMLSIPADKRRDFAERVLFWLRYSSVNPLRKLVQEHTDKTDLPETEQPVILLDPNRKAKSLQPLADECPNWPGQQ